MRFVVAAVTKGEVYPCSPLTPILIHLPMLPEDSLLKPRRTKNLDFQAKKYLTYGEEGR